jgi:hypothetical protein
VCPRSSVSVKNIVNLSCVFLCIVIITHCLVITIIIIQIFYIKPEKFSFIMMSDEPVKDHFRKKYAKQTMIYFFEKKKKEIKNRSCVCIIILMCENMNIEYCS